MKKKIILGLVFMLLIATSVFALTIRTRAIDKKVKDILTSKGITYYDTIDEKCRQVDGENICQLVLLVGGKRSIVSYTYTLGDGEKEKDAAIDERLSMIWVSKNKDERVYIE